MKYLVIEIAEDNFVIVEKTIHEFDTQHEAVAVFHSQLANAMMDSTYTSKLIMVVDSNGTLLRREKYVKPVIGGMIE